MDSLSLIFGSSARPKLLRLFLFNKGEAFSAPEVALRAKVSLEEARHELAALVRARLLRKSGSGKEAAYRVDPRFEYLDALDAFIRATTVIKPAALIASLKRAGMLQLILLSGLFTGAAEAGLDLLIVGDRLEERALARTVASLEAELGREVRYAAFSTEDFRYRLGVYDRLIRDVLDYPHRLLLDKIGV